PNTPACGLVRYLPAAPHSLHYPSETSQLRWFGKPKKITISKHNGLWAQKIQQNALQPGTSTAGSSSNGQLTEHAAQKVEYEKLIQAAAPATPPPGGKRLPCR